MSELPLATTKQFRKAALAALKQRDAFIIKSYTDRPRPEMGKKRYCSYWVGSTGRYDPDSLIKQIEFALWCQGVTAKTRFVSRSLRGTCVLEK